MPTPLQALNHSSNRIPAAIRPANRLPGHSIIMEQLANQQHRQQALILHPAVSPVRLAMSWIRTGLGRLENAVTGTLSYLFGPLFWYAFEAQLRQAAQEYDAQREHERDQARLHN